MGEGGIGKGGFVSKVGMTWLRRCGQRKYG